MTLCINPGCPKPQNSDKTLFCQACGTELLLQGRYRATSELGRGGFGKTYEVDDQGTSKVLKILINTSPEAISRFKREANALAQLTHPGIPRVEANGYFEHSLQGGQFSAHCFVMEKIDGDNLYSYMENRNGRPIEETVAKQLLTELLLILQQVHNKDITHRDIKPQNIILKPNGKPVLIDFGAATEGGGGGTEQATNASRSSAVYTKEYAPIEQIYGSADQKSDFYSLGLTFVFLLTGKSPRDKALYDASTQRLKWYGYTSDISPHLAKVIDHMIAPLAYERPESVQAILEQLNPKSSETTSSKSKGDVVEVASTKKERSDQLCIFPCGSICSVGQLASNGVVLAQIGNNFSVTVTPLVDEKLASHLIGHTAEITSVMFSPNGETLASCSLDGTIRVWNIRTGKPQFILNHGSEVTTISFSPDGNMLASGGTDGFIQLWSTRSGIEISKLQYQDQESWISKRDWISKALFSPDGKIIASASRDGKLILQHRTSKVISKLSYSGITFSLAFSPNGQYLAVGTYEKGMFKEYGNITIWILNKDYTAREVKSTFKDSAPTTFLAFDSTSRYLVTANSQQTFRLWNVISNQQITSCKTSGFCIADFESQILADLFDPQIVANIAYLM